MCSAASSDRNRVALPIAASDPHPEFELVVEIAAWPERRGSLTRLLALAVRSPHVLARRPHRRGAAVIRDGHVLVVRHQRIVGTRNLPALACVVDAGEEVSVIADVCREMQRACSRVVQQARCVAACIAVGREYFGQTLAQRPPRRRRQCRAADSVTGPAAASAASRAAPENSPASNAAPMSRIELPIATPPRGLPPCVLNTPNGRFWTGNSAWPLADATQLRRVGSCVASAILRPPSGEPSAHRVGAIYLG